MNANDYQKQAMRTECDQYKASLRMANMSDKEMADLDACPLSNGDPDLVRVRANHAVIGLAGEVGELASMIQKWVYYGSVHNPAQPLWTVQDELGDVLWYAAQLATAFGLKLGDVMEANLRKLRARYPDKYSDERAAEQGRDRQAEVRAVIGDNTLPKRSTPPVVQDGHGFGHLESDDVNDRY